MTRPTDEEIEALLGACEARGMLRRGIAQAGELLMQRAKKLRPLDINRLNRQAWIERLERERGLRGRAHPRPEPPEEEGGP